MPVYHAPVLWNAEEIKGQVVQPWVSQSIGVIMATHEADQKAKRIKLGRMNKL